jgi:hypothetical protein
VSETQGLEEIKKQLFFTYLFCQQQSSEEGAFLTQYRKVLDLFIYLPDQCLFLNVLISQIHVFLIDNPF